MIPDPALGLKLFAIGVVLTCGFIFGVWWDQNGNRRIR